MSLKYLGKQKVSFLEFQADSKLKTTGLSTISGLYLNYSIRFCEGALVEAEQLLEDKSHSEVDDELLRLFERKVRINCLVNVNFKSNKDWLFIDFWSKQKSWFVAFLIAKTLGENEYVPLVNGLLRPIKKKKVRSV